MPGIYPAHGALTQAATAEVARRCGSDPRATEKLLFANKLAPQSIPFASEWVASSR